MCKIAAAGDSYFFFKEQIPAQTKTHFQKMEFTPEQRREMYAKQAQERLDKESTELELHLKQVQEQELLDALIYVKHTNFVDAMKRVDDKSINKYLNPQNREIATSLSKWNDMVRNDTHHTFVNPRNTIKTRLALYLYLRDTFESGTFDNLISTIKVFEKTREEKLMLSTTELLDGDHYAMVIFRKAVQTFLEMNAYEFGKVFQLLQVPTKAKYDNKAYIEKQEWNVREHGFFIRVRYHKCDNPVRNALDNISKYVYQNCGKEVREMIGHVQYTNMSKIVREKKNKALKSEFEKRVKERDETQKRSEGSSFSFESKKDGNKNKKRDNAENSASSDKRPRSVPALRNSETIDDGMDV